MLSPAKRAGFLVLFTHSSSFMHFNNLILSPSLLSFDLGRSRAKEVKILALFKETQRVFLLG